MTIPVRQLKNGFAMPLLGMGSWMLGGGAERDPASDGKKEAAALRSGLELGFRHIDTAEMYAGGFSEEIVGRAIRGWKRSDLFLTSKVWKTHLAYDEVLRACERSLRRLGTDYLDLYLIHQVDDAYPLEETIRALDRLADEKLVRHIGVSNFAVARLERARACAGHPIAANQVHYNLAVREAELSGLTDYCVEHDIMLIAWRPLQKGTLDAEAPELLREIARRHGRTPAQIALAWLAAQPNTVTISTMRDRRHQLLNCEALEFTLPAEELLRLSREFPGQEAVSGAVPLR